VLGLDLVLRSPTMPSPFPGMDPYLEISGDWRDFHLRFLCGCSDALAEGLSEDYIVRIEEMAIFDEVKQRWIEVRRAPNWVPVTIIDLLSPSDGQGQGDHPAKSKLVSLATWAAHHVELDLLIGDRHLFNGQDVPGDYHAVVSRSGPHPMSEVFAWSIRDPLPIIPIPLMAPDPDVPLDLATIFATVYQRARYERSIDYTAPLSLPLSTEDRAWVEALARSPNPPAAR
jgi:hypothetical protein